MPKSTGIVGRAKANHGRWFAPPTPFGEPQGVPPVRLVELLDCWVKSEGEFEPY